MQHIYREGFQKGFVMTACNEHPYRSVEKMTRDRGWVGTTFQDLREGEIVRFFDPRSKTPLEKNGATEFVVVYEARRAGHSGDVKVSVVPYRADQGENPFAECPHSGNILTKTYGRDKLIEATGCCTECRNMRACLKARHSSAYFEQLGQALGLHDADN